MRQRAAPAWRTRLALFLVALALAAAVAAGVLHVALGEAERGLVAALEGKAKAHARIVRGDVELAIRLGIPLEDLPGAYDYLEGGAQADPDIRFVAITDPDLVRLHYGGIGRARLDPLLDSEAVRIAAESAASHPDQPLRALGLAGFSITLAPLFDAERHAGFIVVAVQGRQVQEVLLERLIPLAPLALALLVLLLELVLWTCAVALEEPWRRLARMMRALCQGRVLIWSERHDRSELGLATRLVNGIFHRLRDRAERLAQRAAEVERAVFEQEVAQAVREHVADLDRPPLAALTAPVTFQPDRRPSDVQPALVLFVAAAALGIVAEILPHPLLWPLPWAALPVPWPSLLLGAALGLAASLLVRRPGWLLVGAGLVIAVVALAGAAQPLPGTACLAAVAFMTLTAAWLYLRRTADVTVTLWLALRALAGLVAGALIATTLVLEQRLAVLPWLQLLFLALAVLASNSTPVVRRQLFAGATGGRRSVAEPGDGAEPAASAEARP